MIRTILLDLDDTIFDFKACERQALSCALDFFHLSYTDDDLADYSRINDGMWKMLERGEIKREDLKTRRFSLFLSRYADPPSAEDFAEKYMQMLSRTSTLEPHAREVLSALSSKYAVYAVTNGYEFTQRGRIASAEIGGYFRNIFISQEVGAVKPKKEFFDYCVAHIPDFHLAETVLIGDSLTSDIAGGNAYGLFTIRYNPSGKKDESTVIPDREVSSLTELIPLLESL